MDRGPTRPDRPPDVLARPPRPPNEMTDEEIDEWAGKILMGWAPHVAAHTKPEHRTKGDSDA